MNVSSNQKVDFKDGTAYSTDGKQVTLSGDFNGDGREDIAYRRNGDKYWKVMGLIGAASNYFKLEDNRTDFSVGNNQIVLVGDFDGDGKSDIAWRRDAWKDWLINYGNNTTGWLADNNTGLKPITTLVPFNLAISTAMGVPISLTGKPDGPIGGVNYGGNGKL
ncbi:MAG: VCBS repeat-containing protein, partial [Bacteroidales bacterium]|nr:VCBS repeat-containing protein [Bacteroidales bacterium]